VQPAVERVDHAQPIRGHRRLAYAAFDGLLVGLITYQSLPDARVTDGAATLFDVNGIPGTPSCSNSVGTRFNLEQ
jgi:hypothetical protein